jgi:hypothetical protein
VSCFRSFGNLITCLFTATPLHASAERIDAPANHTLAVGTKRKFAAPAQIAACRPTDSLFFNHHRTRATKGTIEIPWETLPKCRKSLSPAFVRTSRSSLSTPTRPRRGTSSRPSSSRSASRTTTPSVTSVSLEPSGSPPFPVLVSCHQCDYSGAQGLTNDRHGHLRSR